MGNSPFIFGHTVSNKAFTNREAEIRKLKSNLQANINTMIISPRRWGKSSLVEKATKELALDNQEISIMSLDLFSVSGEEEFLQAFARAAVKASSTKWEEWLQHGAKFFQQLMPKLSIGVDPVTDFNVSFEWKELRKHREEILNLPEIIASRKKIKIIVCLDEFQQISNFQDFENLERSMRASWQKHKHVTYCLYGSKRHMMTDIFNNPAKPFYRFGDIILLPKISRQTWIHYITKGFVESNKSIEQSVTELIADKMKNHSWYVQQLAHYTWTLTDSIATELEFQKALTELIESNGPLYQNELEGVSATQINLLKAVLKGETQLTGASTMDTYQLGTPRNVSKNRAALIKKDLIQIAGNRLEIVDPAFELWLRKVFFNESYL